MAGEPNELPEGGEGGGSGTIRFPKGEFPQELPVASPITSQAALLQEVLRVRGRLHQMENAQLIQSVVGRSAAAAVFHPAELPEGGEGGGGGFIGEFPGEFPAELPVDLNRFAVLENQVAQLTAAITQLSEQVKQIQR